MKNTIVIKQTIQPVINTKEVEITLPAFFKGHSGNVYLGIYTESRMLCVQLFGGMETVQIQSPHVTTDYTPCTEEEFAAAHYKASAALSKAYDAALGVELPEQLKAA